MIDQFEDKLIFVKLAIFESNNNCHKINIYDPQRFYIQICNILIRFLDFHENKSKSLLSIRYINWIIRNQILKIKNYCSSNLKLIIGQTITLRVLVRKYIKMITNTPQTVNDKLAPSMSLIRRMMRHVTCNASI